MCDPNMTHHDLLLLGNMAHLELVLVATVALDGLQRASFLLQNYAVLNTAGTPMPARATFSVLLDL